MKQESARVKNNVQFLNPELQKKLSTLQHLKKENQSRNILHIELISVEASLEKSYFDVRNSMPGSLEEERLLFKIRNLENKRFRLLSKINGNKVREYAK